MIQPKYIIKQTLFRIFIILIMGSLLGTLINLFRKSPLPWIAKPHFLDILSKNRDRGTQEFPWIFPDEIKPIQNRDDVVFIDVRDAQKFSEGHLPNAISISVPSLKADPTLMTDFLFPPEWLIVLYGSSEAIEDVLEAAKMLQNSGVKYLYIVKGGWIALENLPKNS